LALKAAMITVLELFDFFIGNIPFAFADFPGRNPHFMPEFRPCQCRGGALKKQF